MAVRWEPAHLVNNCRAEVIKLELQTPIPNDMDRLWDVSLVIAETFDTIDRPGCLSKWRLVLGGGLLAGLDFVKSHGREGACLFFKSAIQHHRAMVWTSAAWALKHPLLLDVLHAACNRSEGRWETFVGTPVDFVARSLAPQRRGDKKLYGIVLSWG